MYQLGPKRTPVVITQAFSEGFLCYNFSYTKCS